MTSVVILNNIIILFKESEFCATLNSSFNYVLKAHFLSEFDRNY